MKVLGIETSCDETSVAIVDHRGTILTNLVRTQFEEHKKFMGVVPEIAARAHIDVLPDMIRQALEETHLTFKDFYGIAVTAGPGLIGGLSVGVMMAKAIASTHDKPFLAVNHLVAHALTTRLTHQTPFPYLVLLVSGGHCQLLIARDVDDFELLGQTIDDAVGEAFDKTAKLLGYGYPGGPQIEEKAKTGDPTRFAFPRPLITHPRYGFNFSFSGLKTAVRETIYRLNPLSQCDISDICASFQQAVADIFTKRADQALKYCQANAIPVKHFVIAGGVASNHYIREALIGVAGKNQVEFVAPPVKLCTDNAAMVAWAGLEKLKKGHIDDLSVAPRPRWPLPSRKGRKCLK